MFASVRVMVAPLQASWFTAVLAITSVPALGRAVVEAAGTAKFSTTGAMVKSAGRHPAVVATLTRLTVPTVTLEVPELVAEMFTSRILEGDGYRVCAVADGSAALVAVDEFQPDLAMIDDGLPGAKGIDLARRLRQASDLPIIFVTGADSPEDIRRGFSAGADDYIVKPFDAGELSARVRAVLRRTGREVVDVWKCGDLVLDEGACSVTRAGAPVALTATELQLLSVFMRQRNRMVPKAQLLARVGGYDPSDHLVEVHVSALRRKLEVNGPRMIHTIRGLGYILRP